MKSISSTSINRLRYDVVGDIAIIKNVPHETRLDLAQSILKNRKNLNVVLAKSSPVSGSFRLFRLEFVAGEKRTTTVHRENSCLFLIDLSVAHFSPRLVHERRLIAESVSHAEYVLNMFGGVGTFSIEISKRIAAKVYSVDINPEATRLCLINVLLNRIRGRVTAVLADAAQATEILFLCRMSRVLLPLPLKSRAYLSTAVSALKGEGIIHYYDFIQAGKGESPAERILATMRPFIDLYGLAFGKVRIVKSIAPRRYLVSLELRKSSL
ncbi:MAG: hypothetical protein QW828_07730 [Candidatus Bathyarchaeia archaeon]